MKERTKNELKVDIKEDIISLFCGFIEKTFRNLPWSCSFYSLLKRQQLKKPFHFLSKFNWPHKFLRLRCIVGSAIENSFLGKQKKNEPEFDDADVVGSLNVI